MKIKCIINDASGIKDNFTLNRLLRVYPESQLDYTLSRLKIGAEYCVYALEFADNFPWFWTCAEDDDTEPQAYPAEVFDVIDGSMPSYWRLSRAERRLNKDDTKREIFYAPVITFFELAEDHSFSSRLNNEDTESVEIFKRYRELMDKEAGIIYDNE